MVKVTYIKKPLPSQNTPPETKVSNKSYILTKIDSLTKIVSRIAKGLLSILSFGYYPVHPHNHLTNREVTNLNHQKELKPKDKCRPVRSIDLSQLKEPPTREAFVEAIHRFKEKHNVKLKDFLVGRAWNGNPRSFYRDEEFISENQAHLREEFFNDPVIRDYLSRDSKFVLFYENRPALISDPTKPNESDYYECKIYALAAQKKETVFLPYRDNVMEDSFYKEGTSDQTIFREVKTSSTGNYKVCQEGKDIYQIRKQANLIESGFFDTIKKEYEGVPFILSSNAKDTHSTTVISVFQKATFRHLASIFINSYESEEYFQYLSVTFNLRSSSHLIKLSEKECYDIRDQFPKRMGDNKAYLDNENRVGYMLHSSQFDRCRHSSDLKISEVNDAFVKNQIDIIYHLTLEPGKMTYDIEGNRKVPLLDASHNLQTNDEDTNCSLYSLNFLQGIADMLGNTSIADKVYALAEQLDSGTESEKKGAQLELSTIFKEDLKSYLPAYYDEKGNQKPYDQIKEHHLYQRWDLGSLGMKNESLIDSGYLGKGSLKNNI